MHALEDFRRIAEVEFADIVQSTMRIDYKIRMILVDNSFVDIFLSQKLPGKFGFHWECMDESGAFYRYDNVPDKKWKTLSTYPFHFHRGSQDNVEPSPFSITPIEGFIGFMEFIRNRLK
jgi:hypothetical protein